MHQAEEYNSWKERLLSLIEAPKNMELEALAHEQLKNNAIIKKGRLRMRPSKGGEVWDEFNFALTASAMIVLDPDTGVNVVETYVINPSCSVFETNLGRNAFELVTPKKVLHVQSDSRDISNGWIKVLRETISESSLETNDPLLRAAIEKMKDDVIYNVSFHEDKPLGVVLERSGEWAIVKLANERETGVAVGSALMAVNNEEVMFSKYQETIGRLKNWRPPLRLTFLKAPEKRGYLVKESRGRNGTARNWKRRFFTIEQGRIQYKEKETGDAEVKGDIPLMGSAVSLASSQETGKFFCFRLVSGITCLTAQAETFDDLMDWASTLYHAIGIANGGAHVLRAEYQKRTNADHKVHAVLPPLHLAEAERAEPAAPPAEPAAAHVSPPSPPPPAAATAVVKDDAAAKADDFVNRVIAESAAKARAERGQSPVRESSRSPPRVERESVEVPVPVQEPEPVQPEPVQEPAQPEPEAVAEAPAEPATAPETVFEVAEVAAALPEVAAVVAVAEPVESEADRERREAVYHLQHAVDSHSISMLQGAIPHAESCGVAAEKISEARVLLARLKEEEEAARHAEAARLEAEAAALDAALAAEAEAAPGGAKGHAGAYSDDDDEDLDVNDIIYLKL